MDEGEWTPQARAALADQFFRYIGAILPAYYFIPPRSEKHVRGPHAYALLVGMNALLLGEEFSVQGEEIRRASPWPTRSHFEDRLVKDKVWTRKTRELQKPIAQFVELEFIKLDGRFRIEKSGLDVLLIHARGVFTCFMGAGYDLDGVPEAAWLQLNQHIFKSFFLTGYGPAWLPLRDDVNSAIAEYRGRTNLIDPLSENTHYWTVFNIVMVFGEFNSLNIGSVVSAYGLGPMARNNDLIADAEKEFVESGVFETRTEHASRIYSLRRDFHKRAEELLPLMASGLNELKAICGSFAKEYRVPTRAMGSGRS